MSGLQKMLNEIASLKPMPRIAGQIIKKVEDPNSSIADIADLIVYDPSLTANILKMCNSAYFNLSRKVDSVQDAISMLGLDQVVDLVLLKGGAANLVSGQEGYGLNEGALWKHAVSSALIAKDIARQKRPENRHMIFTAALLKDIGKVILDRYVSDSMARIHALVQTDQYSFGEAEKEVIGISHAELGGIVAKMWGFSPRMVFMIRNHHLADQAARNDMDIAIVYLADTICMMMGIGGGADGLAYRFYNTILEQLGVNSDDLQRLIAEFGEKMKQVEDLMQAA